MGSVEGSDAYVYIRVYDDSGDSFRLAYTRSSNSLEIIRTVDGSDVVLKTI